MTYYEESSKSEDKTDSKDIVKKLKSFTSLKNLVEEADLSTDDDSHENVVKKIGDKVMSGYKADLESMSEWLSDIKKVEELASMYARKKNTPLPNSANIKFPLITKAAYEFSSRTYPEIIKDGKVVKGRVIGEDLFDEKETQCENVSDYMNYQLLFEDEEWEMELDMLLNRLPLVGFLCKKSYFDPIRKKIKSILCDPNDLIIHADVKTLNDARRISHVLHYRLNDIIERANAGIYCKEVVDKLKERQEAVDLDPKIKVIEQHTFLDLDDDCYSEPYIVWVLEETGEVLRIAARFDKEDVQSSPFLINAKQFFTDYHFLVCPKGKFQSVGFGILMLHLNETINSVFNQLIDAGQLANLQGGYKDSRLKNMGSGDTLHDPGQWKSVKAMAGASLKDGMYPINYKEPSSVLFQLLSLMIQTGKDLSSSTEVMTGATSADNAKTGAVQALQAQGLKVFTSIQRRIYRSLTNEFRKIYKLDAEFLNPIEYFHILGKKKVVKKDDFDVKHIHIIPVADPNLSSEFQRGMRNQLLIAAQALPGVNKIAVSRELLNNPILGIPVDKLMMSDDDIKQSSINPDMIKIQGELHSWAEDKKLKAEEISVRQFEAKIKWFLAESAIIKDKANSMLMIAQAQAQQDNGKMKEYELQLDTLTAHLDAIRDAAKFMQDQQHHNDNINMQQQQMQQDQGQHKDNLEISQQEADTNAQQPDQAPAS